MFSFTTDNKLFTYIFKTLEKQLPSKLKLNITLLTWVETNYTESGNQVTKVNATPWKDFVTLTFRQAVRQGDCRSQAIIWSNADQAD